MFTQYSGDDVEPSIQYSLSEQPVHEYRASAQLQVREYSQIFFLTDIITFS